MLRILFICHGNICRSPMAEFIMKDIIVKHGEWEHFYVESAATSYEEIGNPVYGPARRKLAEHGLGCEGKKARRISKGDYAKFDLIIGMDEANLRNMRREFGGDPEGKLSLLLQYAGLDRDVEDPWYTRDFESAWQDIKMGCEALWLFLADKEGIKRT